MAVNQGWFLEARRLPPVLKWVAPWRLQEQPDLARPFIGGREAVGLELRVWFAYARSTGGQTVCVCGEPCPKVADAAAADGAMCVSPAMRCVGRWRRRKPPFVDGRRPNSMGTGASTTAEKSFQDWNKMEQLE